MSNELIKDLEKETAVVKTPKKNPAKESSDKRRKQMEKDLRMVKGMFKNTELPGAPLSFTFLKYKEVPVKTYTFEDGGTYEVPYMIANHINNNCWYPVYKTFDDGDGKFRQKIGQKVQRFSFIPLDFMEELDTSNDILTVEHI